MNEQLVRRALGVADGVLLQGLAHQILRLGFAPGCFGGFVVVDVLGVDHNFNGGGVVELLELQRGELRLGGSPTAEDVHLGGLIGLECFVHIVGNLRDVQFLTGFGENARDVKTHVAHADHGNFFCRQVPGAGEFGVTVVETNEFRSAVAAL